MPRLDYSIDVKAPREKVFEYVTDVSLHPQWVKWAKRVEPTSTGAIGVGSTDIMLMQVGPKKEEVEEIVTEYKEGEVFTRRHTKGMTMTDRLAMVTTPEGTKVAWSVEYTPPMGMMGKMMDMIFMERLFDQLMGDSILLLKENIETAK